MTRTMVGLLGAAALTLLAPPAWAAKDEAPKDLPPCPTGQDRPDPGPLLRRIELTLEGRTSVGTMTMTIKTTSWTRTLQMKVWTKGRDYALVRVLKGGPRETGLMTLKRQKQLWNYLPQAGRVMKLPSGMLGDSWMGSDFTNDDLVRGTSLVKDFDSKVTGAPVHEGRKAWLVVLVPRPSATVVWGRIEMLVDRASCVPVLERFFDEDGKLARTMTLGDIRTIGWRQFPGRMTVKPQGAARETAVSYGEIRFDVDVPDDTFSLHRLQQGR
jgi:hypothetical protein